MTKILGRHERMKLVWVVGWKVKRIHQLGSKLGLRVGINTLTTHAKFQSNLN